MNVNEESIEYRVMVEHRDCGRRVVRVNRPENPFADREQAEVFAAQFTPPKFIRAWVEERATGPWQPVAR